MFANENYLDEPQDTEFKGTIINLRKDSKEFKVDTKKQFSEIKEKEIMVNTQEIQLIKIMKTIQDLKIGFNRR